MSDGIHHSQRESAEAIAAATIAKAILSYIEEPTPEARVELENIIRTILATIPGSDADETMAIVQRLEENNNQEWARFFRNSVFQAKYADYDGRFSALVKKRCIYGY